MRLEGRTLWLTQQQLADLYESTPQDITQHIRAIYTESELIEAASCKPYLQVRDEAGRQAPTPECDLPKPDAMRVQHDTGREVTIMDYAIDGRPVVRYVRVGGLAHAWSGGDGAFAYNDPEGPDATALIADFLSPLMDGGWKR